MVVMMMMVGIKQKKERKKGKAEKTSQKSCDVVNRRRHHRKRLDRLQFREIFLCFRQNLEIFCAKNGFKIIQKFDSSPKAIDTGTPFFHVSVRT